MSCYSVVFQITELCINYYKYGYVEGGDTEFMLGGWYGVYLGGTWEGVGFVLWMNTRTWQL